MNEMRWDSSAHSHVRHGGGVAGSSASRVAGAGRNQNECCRRTRSVHDFTGCGREPRHRLDVLYAAQMYDNTTKGQSKKKSTNEAKGSS